STYLNTGTVRKSAVTDADDRSFLHASYILNTGGSFDVEAGRLALGQAQVSSSGMSVQVAADAVLDLTDDSSTTYSGVFGNGSGSGHIRLINNNLYIGATGATFNFAPGLLEWTGGQIVAGPVGLTNT